MYRNVSMIKLYCLDGVVYISQADLDRTGEESGLTLAISDNEIPRTSLGMTNNRAIMLVIFIFIKKFT